MRIATSPRSEFGRCVDVGRETTGGRLTGEATLQEPPVLLELAGHDLHPREEPSCSPGPPDLLPVGARITTVQAGLLLPLVELLAVDLAQTLGKLTEPVGALAERLLGLGVEVVDLDLDLSSLAERACLHRVASIRAGAPGPGAHEAVHVAPSRNSHAGADGGPSCRGSPLRQPAGRSGQQRVGVASARVEHHQPWSVEGRRQPGHVRRLARRAAR